MSESLLEVADRVHYWPDADERHLLSGGPGRTEQPFAAIVSKVNPDGTVNLSVFTDYGDPRSKHSVRVIVNAKMEFPCCTIRELHPGHYANLHSIVFHLAQRVVALERLAGKTAMVVNDTPELRKAIEEAKETGEIVAAAGIAQHDDVTAIYGEAKQTPPAETAPVSGDDGRAAIDDL